MIANQTISRAIQIFHGSTSTYQGNFSSRKVDDRWNCIGSASNYHHGVRSTYCRSSMISHPGFLQGALPGTWCFLASATHVTNPGSSICLDKSKRLSIVHTDIGTRLVYYVSSYYHGKDPCNNN